MDGKVIGKTSGRMVDTSKCFNLGHSWQGPFFFSEITRPFSKKTSFGCFWVNNEPNHFLLLARSAPMAPPGKIKNTFIGNISKAASIMVGDNYYSIP